MKIRDLQYAVAVADEGHFGRAAETCHVSQPALSGQIRKLEDHLGVLLFERTNRRVRTTAAGEEILSHARELLALAERIEETALELTDPLSGELTLGMIPTIAPYLTSILLPSVDHGLPNIRLRLSEGLTADLERSLVEGSIDLAIIATPVEDRRLADVSLYREPFWVVLPHGHPLEREDEVDISDIAPDDLLLLADGHCLRDQVLAALPRGPVQSAAVNTTRTSLGTILALVGAGVGVTLMPALGLMGSWITDSGVVIRREKSGTAGRMVRLAFRGSYPRRAVIDKLADIVGAILPDTVMPEKR
jgi:LysR family hydrogen peroxide-inducible transcriptional activator